MTMSATRAAFATNEIGIDIAKSSAFPHRFTEEICA